MAMTFDQFMAAIAGQESGGLGTQAQYSVVNAYGAVGRYQVLKSNVPGWSKAALGHSITWQQFRDSPELQEKIVRHRLKGYWDKYGARGAASAWYSGNPNLHNSTSAQPGGPSIKSYVDSVIKRAGGMPASGGATITSGAAPAVKEKAMARDEMAEQYGYVESLFNSVPELKSLFNKAVKDGWTAGKFQAELRDTKWWRTKPESTRKFLVKQYGDPASARQDVDQMYRKVKTLAAGLGAPTDPKRIKDLAVKALMNGWDDSMMRYEVAKTINLKGDIRVGEAGEAYDKLASFAYDMGIPLADSWADSAVKNITAGLSSAQEYEDRIRKMAKATFPQWAKQIDSGQSVAELASPYFQSMSGLLEMPSGSINLFDPTIKKALQFKDPKTGKNSVKPIWQFENELRNDQRWKNTKNAQDSIMQMAHQVLSDFGLSY